VLTRFGQPLAADCSGGCSGAAVSTKGQAQVQAAVQAIDADLCANFVFDGCSYAMPSCALPPPPTCKQNQ
jgi:hypothetical protein